MISTSKKNLVENLIPVLSKKEKQDLIAYHTVYEKYFNEFSEKAKDDLKDHPVFEKLIRDIPKEVHEANNKLKMALQKDAILNDKWHPYIEYQVEKGIAYAKMGLDFKSWYEVVVLVKNYITPLLSREYLSSAQLLSSINGMNRFMDIAMGIMGDAYLQEKQEIIQEDQEKIKKLVEELEQKVIERTAQLESNILHLKASEEKFRNLIKFSPLGMMLSTVQGKIIECNQAILDLGGFESKEEFINTPAAEYYLDVNVRKHLVELFKKEGVIKNFELQLKRKNGDVIWINTSIHPFKMPDKKMAMLSTSIEITERKKAEGDLLKRKQKLGEANERFEYATLATNEIIWEWKIEEDLVWWNDNYFSLLGIKKDTEWLEAKSWKTFIHPDDYDRFIKSAMDLLKSEGKYLSVECRFLNKKGSVYYYSIRGYVIYEPKGKPIRMIGALINISESTRLKQKLEEQNKSLEDLVLVEKIINIINELTQHRNDLHKINNSAYISDKLNYNYTYLSNLFKEKKGITIAHYIILQKTELVKELLIKNQLSLTEISQALHYSSVAYLSNQFRSITKITPTAFRQQTLKKLRNA